MGDKEHHYSDADPFADKPPRLIVGINRVKLDPNRTDPYSDEPGKAVPDAAKVTGVEGATWLTEILDWVKKGLEAGLDDAWKSDGGKDGEFDDTAEEKAYAKRFAELFTCSAYGGPDIAADFVDFGKADPAKPERKRPLSPTAYIYQRFQKKHATRVEYCTKLKIEEAELTDNPDPAYSLFLACQHLSTMSLLGRGFNIEHDMLGVGLAAAKNGQHPIFSKERGGAWHDWKGDHGEKPLAADYAIGTLSIGPGSVYCYDPYGNLQTRQFWLVDSDFDHDDAGNVVYEQDASGAQAPKISAKRRTELWQKDAELSKTFKGDRDKDDSIQYAGPKVVEDYQRDADGDLPRTPITLRKIQAEGSHIWNVLRVEKAKKRFQAFDASATQWINQGENVPFIDEPSITVPALSATTNVGMFEGDWGSAAYRGNHYVGLGVPPAAPDLAGMTEFMGNARPVGLARMVITRRIDTYNRPDVNDILFVSQFVRMWGSGATDNYHPSRFLMSVRDTPYYEDLRVWWFLYAPRGKLAEAMWREGARDRSMDDFFNETLAAHAELNAAKKGVSGYQKKPEKMLYPSVHFLCASVISHDANGLAHVAWRNRIAGTNGAVPSILKRYFIDATPENLTTDGTLAKLGCAWNGEYVHSKLEEAGGKVTVPEPFGPPEEPGPSPAVSGDGEGEAA